MMIFTTHLLLYLSVQGVSLACQQRGRFRFVGEFGADEVGYQAFSNVLGQFKHATLSMMVDSVDEQYHAESFPHVLGAARAQMLARRLRQVTRDSEFSAAWFQGREADVRRDDRYLLVSLNNLEWAKVWLDILSQYNVHLALLTTVPMVSNALVRHFPPESAPMLWVTQHSGGTRLSFFSQGRLLFSRLSPLDASQSAENLAEEIIKTRYYLSSHQYLPHQSPLVVTVLDTQQNHQRLCQILSHETGLDLSCQVRAGDVFAKRLWVNVSDLHQYSDCLHLAALGRYSAPVNLATPAMVLGYRQRQWRNGLYFATVISLGVAALMGGYLSYQRDQLTIAEMQTRAKIAQQQLHYQQIQQHMLATPVPPVELKAAVEAGRTLDAAPQPVAAYAVLSEVLMQSPHIAITSLTWQQSDVVRQQISGPILSVEGEVHPFEGDYRVAMQDIDQFVMKLRHHARIEKVDVISMPMNRDPASTLHQSAQTAMVPAAFKLKLWLRVSS